MQVSPRSGYVEPIPKVQHSSYRACAYLQLELSWPEATLGKGLLETRFLYRLQENQAFREWNMRSDDECMADVLSQLMAHASPASDWLNPQDKRDEARMVAFKQLKKASGRSLLHILRSTGAEYATHRY